MNYNYEKIKKQFDSKSRKNRLFFDNLIVLIYVELKCRETRDWWKIELPSFRGIIGRSRKENFDCAADILTPYQISAVTNFIFQNKGKEIDFRENAALLFNNCQLTALNVLGN